MPPKQTTPAAPAGSGSAAAVPPARPPARGIAPSRGAAFLAGVGRGIIPPSQPHQAGSATPPTTANRPAGPHFAPKRIVRAAPSPSPGPSSAGAAGTPPPPQPPGAAPNVAIPTGPSGRGRAAGRGTRGGAARGGRGGAARGGAPTMGGSRPPIEMTASGPFALGTGAIRAQKKVTSVAPILNPSGSRSGAGASSAGGPPIIGGSTGASTSASAQSGTGPKDASTTTTTSASASDGPNFAEFLPDDAVPMHINTVRYSSEGLQIIDMQDVPHMDERAPAAIPRRDVLKTQKKRRPRKPAVKLETNGFDQNGDDADAQEEEDAMDLSESDHDEEEPDDLAADFMPVNGISPEDRLYLLQIPRPFPSFVIDPNYVPPAAKPVVKPEPGTEGAALASGDLMEGVQVSTSSAVPQPDPDTKITPGQGIQIPVRGEFSSSSAASAVEQSSATAQADGSSSTSSSKPRRSVSFAPDTVGGPGSARDGLVILDDDDDVKSGDKLWRGNPEGQVGEVLIWRDGSVKLLLGDIVMN
ncbi:hypothetical protein OC846_006345, partial [Tilletia horrida]